MTECSKKWLALARKISEVYATWDETVAITIGGSVARGVADPSSDVDIFVFCLELPSVQQGADAVQTVAGERWKRHDEMLQWGIARDCFHLDDARIDIGYFLDSTAQTLLDDVLVRYDIMPSKQGFLGGLLDCVPVHGKDVISSWQGRARDYPDELRTAVVEAHLWMDPLWIPEIYATQRGDFLFLHDTLVKTATNVLGMLLGLNRIYQAAEWKRTEALIDKMTIAPSNLYPRLAEVFRGGQDDSVAVLTSLVEETFELVEKNMPDLDVGGARVAFETDTDTE